LWVASILLTRRFFEGKNFIKFRCYKKYYFRGTFNYFIGQENKRFIKLNSNKYNLRSELIMKKLITIMFILIVGLIVLGGCTTSQPSENEPAGLINSEPKETNQSEGDKIPQDQIQIPEPKEIQEGSGDDTNTKICAQKLQNENIGPHLCDKSCKSDSDCKLTCCGSINKDVECVDNGKPTVECITEETTENVRAVCVAGQCMYKFYPPTK
jgi:hypothetical protein